uniref:DUF3730 domain-containing protein n=1 Tax=Kalanchoe fedtschenkoi TaxID=63787 RepID=A0A7N0TGW4_KALFE
MDSYAPLLERTRVPQPSLQRLAVISIFSKLRSSSFDSEAGRDAISQCLSSTSPAVVDQSVRELCRLVSESKMDVARGLLELQSALEGADSLFVNVFVKGVGFLIRLGFKENCEAWRECSPETHPFIKILSCRGETQSELRQQVMLIMSQHESFRMREVCDFLRPLLNFSILRIPFLDSPSSTFVRSLVSSMASLACTFRCDDALIILKLLLSCLKFYPQRNEGNLADFACIAQSIADAYVVVLKQLTASPELLINGAQLCGVELVETVLSRCSELDNSSATSDFVLLATQIISVQKEAGLKFVPQLSTVLVALTVILTKSELEYEQVPVVKLLVLLLNWKNENDHIVGRPVVTVSEGLLCIFPVIKLMSSPSKFVKGAASELLLVLEKHMMQLLSASHKELTWSETRFPSISSPEVIVFRLLQNVWHQDKFTSQSSFLNLVTSAVINDEMHSGSQSWTCNLHKFSLWAAEQRKSSLLSKYGEVLSGEMSLLVCAVACVLIVNDSLKPDAVDTLSAVGTLDTKHGVTVLLAILFYINIFSNSQASGEMQLKLLGMLPSLASHSAMVPLIVQTMLPMLVKDTKSVLYATATRLLCKTWEYNDRAFGTLQGYLKPQKFAEFTSERNISISMAACLRDVCRKNPDRGVDLILSVSACIEAHDPPVKALGLECLSHLCEADVIDFYTAWDVITSHLSVNQLDPIVTRSLCLLLRWGAMDSEAYPESESLIRILWDVGTSRHSADCTLWAKVKSTAFEALAHFEFSQLDRSIPEFKAQISDLLKTESDCALLGAIEAIMVKIILYENINRRRLVKEKRVLTNKVEKLLDVFPRSIFSSGNNRNVRELPGAALFTASFFPKDKNDSIPKEVHGEYENALTEIAASLNLSRSIFVAVLAMKSWEPFMKRWIKVNVLSNEGKRTAKVSDTTLKAANDILQSLRQAAENSIPRIAENIALAIGALCTILPPSIHSVKSKSTEFLLTWLSSNEHEHRQWTAALSLGEVSRCLHITDHKLKLQVINGLLQVAGNSKSTLVKGACGVGLGLSCKSLLTQAVDAEESGSNNLTIWRQELDVMEKMVKELCRIIFQITRSSSDILRSLCSFPVSTDDEDSESDHDSDWGFPAVEDDIWGVAGLVMGLGNSVSAVYRAGFQDLVVKIKSMLISWISNLQMQGSVAGFCTERCEIALSIGACLALPVIVAFCLRVELIENDEIEYLFHCYKDHISTLLLSKDFSNIHQCLLLALCTGAGNLLACILNEGVYSIKVQELNELLQLYRKCYSGPFPPLINIGGMLGAVNVLGAGAGIFLENPDPFSSGQTHHELKGSSSVMGPLIRSSICEPTLILLVQEIFVAARNSEENQLRQYAAWALSFLRHHLLSDANKSSVVDMKTSPSIPEDSVVMKLSLWLMHLNYSEKGNITHPNTVATVIRCLSLAPRLPTLDWGAIMRRIMRYELQVADSTAINLADENTNVRERCLEFSLVHANKVDLLQRFLDELTDLSRFESLELNLQSLIVQHLSDLIKVFSGSRLQKLFNDILTYLSSSNSFKKYSLRQKSSLRKSVWKGLNECLVEASTDASEHMVYFEKCMKVLFQLLPRLKAVAKVGIEDKCFAEEWSAALLCLEKAQPDWLSDLLQVQQRDIKSEDVQMMEVKKLQTKAKLVGRRSIALSELGRVKTLVLDSKSLGAWDVLIEIVVALQHADSSCRREWLLDAVQMSCISRYPSMVLQFIGLLAGSFCKYMPLLILDRLTVLSDLPVTLKSLLTDPKWEPIAEPVATHLFTAAERIYEWRTCLSHSIRLPSLCNIDSSEDAMADFLVQVLYHTCVSLRHYLPLDKQLRLSDMSVP